MSDLETDERLSAELKGAGWSLDPPDGAKDRILERVARRRRTFHVWLAGGATAVVLTSAVLVWPALTGQTASGPTPPANGTHTTPPTDPQPRSVLPPHAVRARLSENTWHVTATTRTPRVTRQEAVALARTALGVDPLRRTVHTWLLNAISLRPSIDLTCLMGCRVNPAWLVQFPSPPLLGGPPATPHSMVGNLVLIDATTGDILPGSHTAGHPHQKAVPGEDQLVGFSEVAFPLPPNWTFRDFNCGQPQSDTVDVEPASIQPACQGPQVKNVSSIVIDDLESSAAFRWQATATEAFTLQDGTPALYGSAIDEVGQYTTVVVIRALDAIAVGISPEPGMLDQDLRLLSRMPTGDVAMPTMLGMTWTVASTKLQGLGLVPRRHEVDGVREVQGTDPASGVVVRIGSIVTVDVGA